MKKAGFLGLLLLSLSGFAQLDSLEQGFSKLFYIDAYYSYDFNEPYDNQRPFFLYQYNQHNQMSLNMAIAQVSYTKDQLTANLGVNFGDFPSANMAHEKPLLRSLYEANIQYRFTDQLELTAGMFSSHMGFESALSFDNLLTSHSLASEWTPYYLAGVKLAYQPFKQWYFSATLANGNQNITEAIGNTTKAGGIQATYQPNEKISVNYSNFYSNDQPDSAAVWVLYNNFYVTYQPIEQLEVILGFDYAIADNSITNKQSDIMVGSSLIRYYFTPSLALAGRYELYMDPDGVYIQPAIGKFEISSFTGGLEYHPMENIKFKLEGRIFNGTTPIFRYDQGRDQSLLPTTTYLGNNSNLLISIQAKF